jgi:MYXO-CTERM domain-containing protein
VKKFAVSALAVAALAGTALGQGQTTNQVRLELRLVSQTGLPGTSPVQSFDVAQHPDTSSGLGVARRFEVQYRLVDLDPNDAFVPAGLTAGQLRIVATGGTLERAILSKNEARNPSGGLPPISQSVNLDTDTSPISGNMTIGPFRGLQAPFRGGIPAPAPNNDNAANGTFSAGNTVLSGITPLSLSQTDQNDGGWYGLYSFNFLPTAGTGNVEISFDADPQTGNRFGFFTDGDPVPVTSPVATGDSATILVPAPGAMALLGLGGLIAGRRRRQA